MALKWLRMKDYESTIRLHDANRKGGLQNWRDQMKGLATELTGYLQGNHWNGLASRFSAKDLNEIFLFEPKTRGSKEVFDPWINWWKGNWEKKYPQFHIWDTTESVGDQYVQPVSQSTRAHVSAKNHDFMLKVAPFAMVDIGINLYSDAFGVTGWVSKKQVGSTELPHIGYRLDTNTLVWITHEYPAATNFTLDPNESKFWIFFEWIANDKATYRIQGRKFDIVVQNGRNAIQDRGALGSADYKKFTPIPLTNSGAIAAAYPGTPPGMPAPF